MSLLTPQHAAPNGAEKPAVAGAINMSSLRDETILSIVNRLRVIKFDLRDNYRPQSFNTSSYNCTYFRAAAVHELSTRIPFCWIVAHASGRP